VDPINEDHAIRSIAFSLSLTRPFTSEELEALRSFHVDFRDQLPAISVSQGVQVRLESGLQRITPVPMEILQFSYMRPDGTPAWALIFRGNEITVECTRYTRWARVWERAYSDLSIAVGKLSKLPAATVSAAVEAATMTVVDAFVTKDPDYRLDELFDPETAWLPRAIASAGPCWHSYSGWFDAPTSTFVSRINNLNISAQQENLTDGDRQFVISITHLQRSAYGTPLPCGDFRDNEIYVEELSSLHAKNKSVLKALLQPEMRRRIALEGGRDEQPNGPH
jgi:uncharacterized protein (TIGR04255 family)